MSFNNSNLIWIDLEMTGLDTQNDAIIEIATVITDKELNKVADGPVFAIHQSDEVLAAMDGWNTNQHGLSGLTERVRESDIDYAYAEQETIEFLEHFVGKGKSPMCGNSICQDRRFLARLMPELEAFFHYRNLDVSTIKELGTRWYPGLDQGIRKNTRHLAQDDVYDSIDELRYYREMLFHSPIHVNALLQSHMRALEKARTENEE